MFCISPGSLNGCSMVFLMIQSARKSRKSKQAKMDEDGKKCVPSWAGPASDPALAGSLAGALGSLPGLAPGPGRLPGRRFSTFPFTGRPHSKACR